MSIQLSVNDIRANKDRGRTKVTKRKKIQFCPVFCSACYPVKIPKKNKSDQVRDCRARIKIDLISNAQKAVAENMDNYNNFTEDEIETENYVIICIQPEETQMSDDEATYSAEHDTETFFEEPNPESSDASQFPPNDESVDIKQEIDASFSELTYSYSVDVDNCTVVIKKIQCSICESVFSDEQALNRHVETSHLNLSNFICFECNKGFSTQGNLNVHIDFVHKKTKVFKCDACVYACKTKGHLKQHIDSVHRKIKYKCINCDYTCSARSKLKNHVVKNNCKVTVKKFECNMCDRVCSDKTTLNRHIQAVHLKLRNYVCDECNKCFSTQGNLNGHVNGVHRKIKDFICIECNYAGTTRGHLNQHIDCVHKKIKKYKCMECDYACSAKNKLNKHIDSKHRKM